MNDDEFDHKARQLYANAAREIPPAVRQRLRVALAKPRPSHQAWQPAVAFASVAILAIGGLLWQRPLVPAATPAVDAASDAVTIAAPAQDASSAAMAPAQSAPPAAVATAPAANAPVVAVAVAKPAAVIATAAYDNDPEFYAWLGNDAPPVPGE